MKTFRLVLHLIKLGDWRLKNSYKITIKYLLGNKVIFFCLPQKYPEGFLRCRLLGLGLRMVLLLIVGVLSFMLVFIAL